MTVLRVAVVGCGQMARSHVSALRRVTVPHRIVGVCDAAREQAVDFARWCGAPMYTSVATLLQEAKPDVVHVCAPPATHAAVAREALAAGAHVYVEKPFAETLRDARELLAIAQKQKRVLCAGHQLVRDPVFQRLVAEAPRVGPIRKAESVFLFQPAGIRAELAAPGTLAAAMLDILPHPLYLLVQALESVGVAAERLAISTATVGPGDIEATLRAPGDQVWGRLYVSVRDRPVASSVSYIGASGALSADFIRGSIGGTPNPGTAPLEKLLNAAIEGAARAWRGSIGLARRLLGGRDYPGLAQMLDGFYRAAAGDGPPPLAPGHLLCVAALYEELAARVHATLEHDVPRETEPSGPIAVVTGAGGMLGRAVAHALAERGYTVRGIGRSSDPADPCIREWRRLDLSRADAVDALRDADVVVHAAAATSGGYESHQLHTVDATRRLLSAMSRAGVSRLIHISSLSVLEPPQSGHPQDETTPLATPTVAHHLGPYTWGKCEAERVILAEGPALGITTRFVRPAALVAWNDPDMPGIAGRRLYGSWHLGLGRPSLPLAIYAVDDAARVIAWMADRFSDAPPVVNLVDERYPMRGALIERFRDLGVPVRMVWVPIALMAMALMTIRRVLGVMRGVRPPRLDAWQVLRPRRFDGALATQLLAAARGPVASEAPAAMELAS